jgi:uncharacterized protein (DUF2062 family)/SAM-dependent methyltransferase
MTGVSLRLRRVIYGLRTEGTGVCRETAAVGLGVFIGCLPFYGFHLAICYGVGSLLRLNRLKMYVAANISNPLVAPWLIVIELEIGAWLRHGSLLLLTPDAMKAAGLSVVGSDLLIGSLAVGIVLAVVAAAATYATLRGSAADREFMDLVRGASDRYAGTSVTAWEFARGKLWNDRVYRSVVCGETLPSGGTLLDVGCGQGLALAMLAEARRTFDAGAWPARWPAPPRFERMIGIENRRRVAGLARGALAGDADIIDGDARTQPLYRPRVVLLFDVLQMMPAQDQEALLAAIAARLEAGGVILVREADASAGWRFTAVRLGNRAKTFVLGSWRQEFHFRTRVEWLACFARLGLRPNVRRVGDRPPLANVLFRLSAAPAGAGTGDSAGCNP